MEKKIYLSLSKFSLGSLFYNYFMFFDIRPYLADKLFIKHKVRVRFDKEFEHPEKTKWPYTVVFCHVRKKDTQKFVAALEDLKKDMVLCGYPDYEKEVYEFLDSFKKDLHSRR